MDNMEQFFQRFPGVGKALLIGTIAVISWLVGIVINNNTQAMNDVAQSVKELTATVGANKTDIAVLKSQMKEVKGRIK